MDTKYPKLIRMNDDIIDARDLFGTYRVIKAGVPESERATLIRFFSKKTEKEPKIIGIRLAHYSLDDLYALKSAWNDRERRQGTETARKHFWYITRTQKLP